MGVNGAGGASHPRTPDTTPAAKKSWIKENPLKTTAIAAAGTGLAVGGIILGSEATKFGQAHGFERPVYPTYGFGGYGGGFGY